MEGSFRALVLGVSLLAVAAGAGAQLLAPVRMRPDAMMNALTNEVMGTLRADRAAGRASDFAQLVESRIVPVFDFPRMTAIALGRNWRLASAAQQDELVAQFKTLLVRTYSHSLLELSEATIDYKPLRAAAAESDVTVRSALQRPGAEPLSVDYDMADGAAGWRVYDVKIAGVSVVLTYRESFATTVRAEGIDGLIKALAEKNRRNQAGADAAQAARLVPVLMIYGAQRSVKP